MVDRGWRRLPASVRVRTTAAATLIVAVALSLGAVILLDRFRTSLEHNRQDAAVSRAADIASLANTGRLPSVLGLPNEDTSFAQVVDAKGQVIAASANISGDPPVGPGPSAGTRSPSVRTLTGAPVGGNGRFGLVSVPASMGGAEVTVYTAFSYLTSDLAVRDVRLGLFIGMPLLLLVVASTTWMIVGRALRPIDTIRAEVASVTSTDLHRRVPEPRGDDEVARLARTMNSMLDRLEVSTTRQRTFVADASHELRSPLASLRAQLEIGLARGDQTDWPKVAEGSLAEEARIERLVRDLLLLASLDVRQQPLAHGATDLSAVVDTDLAGRPARPGIHIQTRDEGPSRVAMSGDLARRVIGNLMDNAQRLARSEVTVTVGPGGPNVTQLTVTDDGPGIRPEDRERVFERFTRLDAARSLDDGGAGLGLAIVRDIVERAGGTVQFVDRDVGARVVVRLPS